MINQKNPRLVSLVLFAAFLMLCGGGDSSAAANSPPSAANKPIMQGLVDMSYIGFYGHGTLPTFNPAEIAPFADSFTGIVINVQWDQLQSNGPDPLQDNNQIDQDLAMVTAYNGQHPTAPLQVKLRVYGGFVAPTWAQSIGGSPIVITDIQHGRSGTVGRWWTHPYIEAWRQLQQKLAQRYDSNPLIHEVAVTSCAAATDEPFVPFDSSGIAEIQAAGYLDAAQEECLRGAVKDYAAWKHTSIDFTFNPFHEFDGGTNHANNQFTTAVMRKCAIEGAHCVLSNHALDNPLDPCCGPVYQEMQTLEEKFPNRTFVDFQTQGPCELDWCGTIGNAVTLKASSVELWPGPVLGGGFTELTTGEVANLANAMATHSQPAASPCPQPPPGCD